MVDGQASCSAAAEGGANHLGPRGPLDGGERAGAVRTGSERKRRPLPRRRRGAGEGSGGVGRSERASFFWVQLGAL